MSKRRIINDGTWGQQKFLHVKRKRGQFDDAL